ncbi:hypothetical protein GCM10023346_01990 [Arthrobacter gyeryongensis]|uniref:Uncharacterized protein n=1 Tax=Arthrobacter gyeryongensis TaxID=1650592 RepID=A0ABP9RZ17_9MICC
MSGGLGYQTPAHLSPGIPQPPLTYGRESPKRRLTYEPGIPKPPLTYGPEIPNPRSPWSRAAAPCPTCRRKK